MTEKKSNGSPNNITGDTIENEQIINDKLSFDTLSLIERERDIKSNITYQTSISDQETSYENSIFTARKIMDNSKTEYLAYDDILSINEMYKDHISDKKIKYIDMAIITSLKDMIRVKFINKNIEQLDNMFARLIELNINDKESFLKIAAIYVGNKDVITTLFRKISSPINSYQEQKDLHVCIDMCTCAKRNGTPNDYKSTLYQPTQYELRLLLDRLNRDDQDSDFYTCSDILCERIDVQKKNPYLNTETMQKVYDVSDITNNTSCANDNPKLLCKRSTTHMTLSSIESKTSIPEDTLFMESIMRDIHHKTNLYSRSDERDKNKTYVADIKIAVFRLIVGVAYRSFRPNSSTDHTNLKKPRSDPYKFIDLIKLIKSVTNLLTKLNVLHDDHIQYMTQLGDILQDKYNKIIEHKAVIGKTNKDLNNGYKYGKIEAELNHNISNIQKIDELKNYDIDVVPDVNSYQSEKILNNANYSDDLKTRIQILNRRKSSLPYIAFKNRYSSVIVEDHDEFIPNALIRNGFWYDIFLPLLLRGLSIDTVTDDKLYTLLDSTNTTDNNDLDILLTNWFKTNYDAISTYCRDITDSFDRMTLNEKLIIKQCWDMTKFYLIDRNKHGSNSKHYDGFRDQILIDLSQYIPFIDEYVGTRYVMDYTMTPSLPQYIGPPIWKFLHAIPEMMEHHILVLIKEQNMMKSDNIQKNIDDATQCMLNVFVDFFTQFLKTYPCPYCRNHLNNFVIKNTEILNYPLEYIFMDWNDSQKSTIFKLNIDDKMRAIKTVSDLRLFLWKFHNAVNSSSNEFGFEIDIMSKKYNSKDSDENSMEYEDNINDNADVQMIVAELNKIYDPQSNSESDDDTSSHSHGLNNQQSNNDTSINEKKHTMHVMCMPFESTRSNYLKMEKSNDEQLEEDMTNRSMNSRNGNYTDGHWPDPNVFDESIKESYIDAINKLIEHRKIFVSTIIDTHKNEMDKTNNSNQINTIDQTINHFNTKIQDIADKIKTDITKLDKSFLESSMMQNIYRVIDI